MKKSNTSYPIDFRSDGSSIAAGSLGTFDPDGVPLVDYDFRYRKAGILKATDASIGSHYTPVTVAIYAMSVFQSDEFDSSEKHQKFFFGLSDWLLKNMVDIDRQAGVWLHSFPVPFSDGLPAPYASGISQAIGVSVLLRAYDRSGDAKYRFAAEKAYNAFDVDVSEGGVSCVEDGFRWIEEWPSSPRSHVLNGFMFALLAIHDMRVRFPGIEKDNLWNSCLTTLAVKLPLFDCGYGSRYDLSRGLVVSDSYHRLHVQLLTAVADISANEEIRQITEKWARYLKVPVIIRKFFSLIENMIISKEYRTNKYHQILYYFNKEKSDV